MKTFYTVICFVVFTVLISVTTYADGWRQSLSYSMELLNDTYFVSESVGFCVGGSTSPIVAIIYKTTDSGLTWKEVYRNTNAKSLTRVTFINSNVGFVGGSAAQLLKTTDSGNSWNALTLTGTTNDVNALYFKDEMTGWVLTNAGVTRTTDGGKTWSSVLALTGATTYDMTFWGDNHGVITGKTIGDFYYTKDGITWTKATAPTLSNPYSQTYMRGVCAVDENNIYAGGWGSLAVSNPTLLVKSTDGGATWKQLLQDSTKRTFDYVFGFYFKDKDNGVAVGGSARGSLVLKTSDGGTSWNQIEVPCGGKLSSIAGIGNSLWATDEDGFIIYSKDFGTTWKMQDAIPGNYLSNIQFTSANIAYCGGFNGTFLKSTDAGKTWKSKYVRVNKCSPQIQDFYFLNDKVGYTAHSYKMVSKTTDGGDTWTALIPDTSDATETMYGVQFITESLGFAVGKIGNKIDCIFKTTDGGKSWELKSNVFKANLRAVSFYDANNGVVVGETVKGGFTTDGGKTWTASTFNNVPTASATAALRTVTFIAANTAIAVGEKLVMKTTDGGATWNYIAIAGISETLTGVEFLDASKGYAIGTRTGSPSKGVIYMTTDAGNMWTSVGDSTVFGTSTLYDIAADSKQNLWVSGDNGKIFTTSPLTNIADKNNPLLTKFELNQNYPNPFNPNTTIEYYLPANNSVTLSIYDALGRCVRILANGEQEAGKHKISLDASAFSSGLYFYSLSVDGKTQTRKMLLIK